MDLRLAEAVRTIEARDDYAKRLQKQNKLLDTVLQRLNGALAHATAQQLRIEDLEDQLQQTTEIEHAHTVETEALTARLKRENKTFTTLQDELDALIAERRAEANDIDAVERGGGGGGAAAGPAGGAGTGAGAGGTEHQGASTEGERVEVWRVTSSQQEAEPARADGGPGPGPGFGPDQQPDRAGPGPGPGPGTSAAGGCASVETRGNVGDIAMVDQRLAGSSFPAAAPAAEASAQTDGAWAEMQAALARAERELAESALASVEAKSEARKAESSHKVAMAFAKQTWMHKANRTAAAAAEAGGELEQARAATASAEMELSNAEASIAKLEEAQEQQAESFEGVLGLYTGMKENRGVELEAIEEELQRMGLTLELPPPTKPKRGARMDPRAAAPVIVLLPGTFAIKLIG